MSAPRVGARLVVAGCQGCGACLLTCPEHALLPAAPAQGGPLVVRAERCTGCGECVEVCPVDALRLDARPALVVGLPVGFVGAAESKAALRASGLPAVSNVSEKGGSAVAAAALNALLYAEVP